MSDIKIQAVTHFESMGQMSIQELPGAVPYGETALPIQQTQVAFADQARSDASMMQEANLNREESESFIATRGLIGRWNTAELMLRAWVEPVKWKGSSDQFRSHLGIPLVAEQFYSIHSVINQTLFGGYQVFKIDATSGTEVECAEAQQAILNSQLKTCGYKGVSAKTEFREITYDGLFYGFGVAHYGWTKTKRNIIKKVARVHDQQTVVGGVLITIPVTNDDDYEEKCIGVLEFNQPHLEHVPVRRARYAPDLRRGDPRVSEWFGRIIYLTAYDLDNLRNTDGWKIPTREQLVKLTTPQMQSQSATNPLETLGSNTGNPVFQQTTTPQKAYPENYTERTQHDPLGRKFEAFDYWTGDRHCIILQKEYCILNETHKFGRPPFLGFCFRNAPDSAHGYGIAYWLTDFQRVCQGIVNAYMDDLNLNIMGTYTASAGTNNTAQAQWIFPGKVFKSDGPNKIEPMTRNGVDGKEPLAVIAQMKSWASSISGAGLGTLGSNPGAAGDVRNPSGVEAMTGGENIKLQDLVDVISEQVFIPFLEFCIEENQKLKPPQIRSMLSESLGKAFKATPIDILNGTYRVDISAGTKLIAREAINKNIGIIQTIIQAPGTVEMLAQQGMKMDMNTMLRSIFDAFGAPYLDKWVVPQTDEDKAIRAAEAQQPKPQDKITQIQASGEVKKEVDNNQAENRMLIETGKHTLKSAQTDHGQSNELELQQKEHAQQEKLVAASPSQQGFDRASKGAYANEDKMIFGQ